MKIGYDAKLSQIISRYGYMGEEIASSTMIHSIILELLNTRCVGKKVAIWGVGKNNTVNSHAAVIIKKYILNLGGLQCLVDSSKDLQGKDFMGYPIIAPERMKEKGIEVVIVASRASAVSIRETLREIAPECECIDIYEELRKQNIIIDYNFFSEQNIYTKLYQLKAMYEQSSGEKEPEVLHQLISYYLKIRDFYYAKKYADEYVEKQFSHAEQLQRMFIEIEALMEEIKEKTKRRTGDICIHLIDSLRAIDVYEKEDTGKTKLRMFANYASHAAIFTNAYATAPTTYESMVSIVKQNLPFKENIYEQNSFMFDYEEFDLLKYAVKENKDISFYVAKDYLIMNESCNIHRKEQLHMSEKLWTVLCDMAESDKDTFNFLYYPWELHFPMLCGYLTSEPQTKHFTDVGLEDMSDFIEQQFTDCLAYVDVQFNYYSDFFSDETLQIFLGDHSQPVYDYEKQVPFFMYYKECDKVSHIAFMISSSRIQAGEYTKLISMLDFNSIMKSVITEYKIPDASREIVQYQYYNIQNKKLRDVAKQKGYMDYVDGIQCFLSTNYLYVKTATGVEEVYHLPNTKENIIGTEEGASFMNQVKEQFDTSFPKYWNMEVKSREKLNFTVGPVMMQEAILEIGAKQLPYFRTEIFSKLVKENEQLLQRLFEAPDHSRTIMLTASGTAAMESSVINCFTTKDKIMVINGGGFGERFAEICRIHRIPYEEILLHTGCALKMKQLEAFEGKGFTGLLINMHETTTGVLYDMDMVGEFCKKNHIFLVVDAISSFLADEIHMKRWNVSVIFTGSQKALSLPPGMTFVILDGWALERVKANSCQSLYLDYKRYLLDGERGQTPFTPAVGILLQLHQRLQVIQQKGIKSEIEKVKMIAMDFREKVEKLPFELITESPSNALTSLKPAGGRKAYEIYECLERNYDIWVCPSGGRLKDTLLRVGHLGALTIQDNDRLIAALKDMQNLGYFKS